MGTVIKFPPMRERHETPAKPPGASAEIIILPVVRIERMMETAPVAKAKAAKSVSRPATKPASRKSANKKQAGKSASKPPAAKTLAKSVPTQPVAIQPAPVLSAAAPSASVRKRKRAEPVMQAPARRRG